jgi:putative lipoic acid-binding regulatory protein
MLHFCRILIVNFNFSVVSMELDESIFKFPCDFPIKAMGKADEDFDCMVVALIRRHCPNLHEGSVETRLSAGGKYMSVTVTIRAESKVQLDNIYIDLTAESRVLVAL